ncbi:MAG TPA: response regulator, partial [Pirellulales bacterium]|nr:response regulator [Pirellulales bacterium]
AVESMLMRVLVAEDNLAMRAVVRFNLQQAGFCVIATANGREAWRALEREEPIDLVITDEQMPEMTGQELCRRMRQDARFAQLPLILLTAKGFELDDELLRSELRVIKLMIKPFSPRELLHVVADCLGVALGDAHKTKAVPSVCR